ncbi:MAG: HEPN domain-containing protein [Alphaproteobacteria bacterium]|nr:HEPN domain-containing protein [Alphaproteobacteria bacterium]
MSVSDPIDWIDHADRDIDTVKRCLGGAWPNIDVACFHIQQATEKLVKALLVHSGVKFPRGKEGHDIGICADRLPDGHSCKEEARSFEFATDWTFKYPSEDPLAQDPRPDLAEVVEALARLEAFRGKVLAQIGLERRPVGDPFG